MIQPIKWTDRKFTFGYDKGYTPFFLERLKMAPPRVEELFRLSNEAAVSHKNGEKWSAKEHLGHLCDLEHLHDGRIDDFMGGAEMLRAADMSNKATYGANHNDQPAEELLARFRKVRKDFIERITTLDEKHFERRSQHPRLQQMITLTDLLFFVAEHDSHHIFRITELIG